MALDDYLSGAETCFFYLRTLHIFIIHTFFALLIKQTFA